MSENFPESTDLESCINTFLMYTKKITDTHMDQREKQGKSRIWSDDSQIARIHEEVSEVYRAIRKGEGKERKIHETMDIIFAAFTLLVLDTDLKFGDVDIELQQVCRKLEERYSK